MKAMSIRSAGAPVALADLADLADLAADHAAAVAAALGSELRCALPAAVSGALSAALVLGLSLGFSAALSPPAAAFQVREAPAANQTDCSWSYGDCGDPGPFTRWFTAIVPYWVNEDAAANAGDPGLTQADIEAAIDASYQTWEDVPDAILTFTSGGTTTARISGVDGINTTLWFNGDGDPCVGSFGFPGGVLAVTISTIRTSGEITDVDLVFDSADTWDWSTACIDYDVQSTMTHEIGHMIGFGHSEGAVCPGDETKPTMCSGYFCDAGVAGRRSLETDDEDGIRCVYPENPTLILIDQTGSMATGGRMGDAQDAANAFVDAFPSNLMAVAAFAQSNACDPPRTGYDLLQDFTLTGALLHDAINSTSACGGTPLWESLCCALADADEQAPSNVLVFTDTEENLSDGDCGCTNFDDVLAAAIGTDVTFYVIDITNYFGLSPSAPDFTDLVGGERYRTDGDSLEILAERTGGLYFAPQSPSQLLLARLAIQSHLMQNAQQHQFPTDCFPQGIAIDAIQRYTQGVPNSPYQGQQVSVVGVVTASEGPFGLRVTYIEDCSGGIRSTIPSGSGVPVGRMARITGVVGQVHGEITLGSALLEPLGAGEVPSPPVEYVRTGRQTELVGRLTAFDGFAGAPVINQRFPLVSDFGVPGADTLWVFLHPEAGIPPATFTPGNRYIIRGILMRFVDHNELAPRGLSDITAPSAVDPAGATGIAGSPVLTIEPNPSTGRTTISYDLSRSSPVSLRVYDVGGRLVRTLADGPAGVGRQSLVWDGRDANGRAVGSGIYFVRLYTAPGGGERSGTIVLTR